MVDLSIAMLVHQRVTKNCHHRSKFTIYAIAFVELLQGFLVALASQEIKQKVQAHLEERVKPSTRHIYKYIYMHI